MDLLTTINLTIIIGQILIGVYCIPYQNDESDHNGSLQSPNRNQPDYKPHDKLNASEFRAMFNEPLNEASEYEFVNITTMRQSRMKKQSNQRTVVFTLKGTDYNLRLTPMKESVVADNTPMWTVKTINGKSYNYERINSEDARINGTLLEDQEQMATLVAYYKDGKIYYDGVFGEGREMRVIKSMPERWSTNIEAGNHVIYRVEQFVHDIALRENSYVPSNKLKKPLENIYPKLLVVVDYTMFKMLKEDIKETIKYVTITWNAANMKFRPIVNPNVRIMITGIIISQDDNALEYVYQFRNTTYIRHVDALKLMEHGGIYFRDQFFKDTGFDNYDAVFTMAGLYSYSGAMGIANTGQICTKSNNVAFVQDFGHYHSIIIVTHELGHLLSFFHDDGKNCKGIIDEDTASIMNVYPDPNCRRYVWSECSLNRLSAFASGAGAACLEHKSRHRHSE